jgi:hypothetical protein
MNRKKVTLPASENTFLGHQSLDRSEAALPFPRGVCTGQLFAQLTVANRAATSSSRRAEIRCRCTCGNECVVRADDLKRGQTKSCGCLQPAKGRYKNGKKQLMQSGNTRALGTTELVREIRPSTLWVTFCSKCYAMGIVITSQLKLGERCPCYKSGHADTPIRCQLIRPVVHQGDMEGGGNPIGTSQ